MIIERYIEVVRDALGHLLELGERLSLPLSLLLGLALVAATVAWAVGRRDGEDALGGWRRVAGAGVGWGCVALVLVASWSALRATRFVAQNEMRRREQAEATSNPVPDAPAVSQAGPAAAILRERTYSSTLTLPPTFLSRLSAEGLGVLAPYLSDPSTQNVVRLRNTFGRKGRDVVFTRQSTVREEEPMPLSDTRIKVTFTRLAGRAYDVAFEGRYVFQNTSPKPVAAHFLFSLPQAGTVRDLSVRVGRQELGEQPSSAPPTASNAASASNSASGEAVEQGFAEAEGVEPRDPNTYEWKGQLAPGEARQATVSYRAMGARLWSYDLGSTRRRVQQFHLDADAGGAVRFARGSLQPTSRQGSALGWELSNVLTAQRLSLAFPSDKEGDQLYLQALTALPVCLVLFACGALALASWLGEPLPPLRLGLAAGAFALGLGASTIAAAYVPPLAALLLAPLAGAWAASAPLGRRFLLAAVPFALLPVAFLSAHHTGLLVLLLGALALGAFGMARKRCWIPGR